MTTSTTRRHAGQLVRRWRQQRRLSQLELSLRTRVSTRYLSCVETGKATPSRQLLLFLATELDIPLRERNVLLLAAGYAPTFGEAPVDATALAPARAALARLLAGHEPFPAVVVDGHWNVVQRNAGAVALTKGIAEELTRPPINVLRSALHPAGLAPRIANFGEWSGHLLRRLRRQIDASGDPALVALDREVRGYPRVGDAEPEVPHDIFVTLKIRYRNTGITLLNTLTVFGAPLDASLADLVLESFHPADAHTAEVLRQAADDHGHA